MKLVKFLNILLKHDGFLLVDANSQKYVIGKPLKEKFKSDLYYIPYMKQKIVIIAGKGSKFYNNQIKI